jgi:ribosome maturation protein Sdo1
VLTRIRHGNQGILDTASNAALENEFGTHVEEDVVKAILEKGTVQETDVCHHNTPFVTAADVLDRIRSARATET